MNKQKLPNQDTVSIPGDIFDKIERYLESKLPDEEAASILQMLEDFEIERTSKSAQQAQAALTSEHFSRSDQ